MNKLKYNRLFFIALIIFIFTSCDKSSDSDSGILGKWDWKISSGGLAGVTLTPESTGNTIILELTPDSIYKEYRNDSLIIDSPFHVSSEIVNNARKYMIVIEDLEMSQHYELLGNDTLVLTDNVADGFTSKYARFN
jgi:hypothetical protein